MNSLLAIWCVKSPRKWVATPEEGPFLWPCRLYGYMLGWANCSVFFFLPKNKKIPKYVFYVYNLFIEYFYFPPTSNSASSSVVNRLKKGLLNGLIRAHCSHQFFALLCKAALCSLANASHYTVFTVIRKRKLSCYERKPFPHHVKLGQNLAKTQEAWWN